MVYWKIIRMFLLILIAHSRMAMLDNPKMFEHPEVIVKDFANPPVQPFHPNATDPSQQKLTPAQMYGVCWMESRLPHGGGIIGDTCGLGKVCYAHIQANK